MAESATHGNPLVGHLECQLEMNSSADALYDIFRSKYDLFPRLKPTVIKTVECSSADVWLWIFFDDKCGTWKHSVEGNNGMKSVTWTLLKGEVPEKLYKALKVKCLFSPLGKGCGAKVTLTYELQDITVPPPNSYMEFICDLLVAAANIPPKH